MENFAKSENENLLASVFNDLVIKKSKMKKKIEIVLENLGSLPAQRALPSL